MKSLLAIAAASLLVPTVAKAPPPGPYPHDESLIVQVICGMGAGTAVKVGWNSYYTAKHVSDNEGCTIDGVPVLVARDDAEGDFAVVIGPSSPHSLPISCAGFKPGQVYLARGHVPGAWFMALPWLATALQDGSFQVFVGEAIPGMSGGAVLDEQGRVVGIVSKRLAARAIPLSETSVCP